MKTLLGRLGIVDHSSYSTTVQCRHRHTRNCHRPLFSSCCPTLETVDGTVGVVANTSGLIGDRSNTVSHTQSVTMSLTIATLRNLSTVWVGSSDSTVTMAVSSYTVTSVEAICATVGGAPSRGAVESAPDTPTTFVAVRSDSAMCRRQCRSCLKCQPIRCTYMNYVDDSFALWATTQTASITGGRHDGI